MKKQIARIYLPCHTTMQSGPGFDQWVLEYESSDKFIEPLMGWTGTTNTTSQIRMKFDTKEEAVRYANKHHIEYSIAEPTTRKIIIKPYANNFE